jgi:hypothetical protein
MSLSDTKVLGKRKYKLQSGFVIMVLSKYENAIGLSFLTSKIKGLWKALLISFLLYNSMIYGSAIL